MTGITTVKDHDDKYHITNIIVVQQQPGDLRPAEEFNISYRQDHGMINIKELLNDQLEKVV